MFLQTGVLPQGQAGVQGQMPPGTSQPQRYPADEITEPTVDIPTEDGARTISGSLGCRMLWNKADIAFEIRKPMSKPSQPSSSPPGGPSDDDYGNGGDDNGSDGNDNASGSDSSPGRSPPPNMSNPQGGTGV